MRKIGICTMYYKNYNYGANLQVYALEQVLEHFGNQVQVVSYSDCTRFHRLLLTLKNALRKKDPITRNVMIRNNLIDEFKKEIPHSRCYYPNTISLANKEFDCFVTGSDQVWNPDWINRYLSLQFVDKKKLTIAYAASTGKINLNAYEQEKLSVAMAHTKHISLREKESIPVLQSMTDKKIEYVLDPTLLLSKKQWDGICSKRIEEGQYLFCYFLSGNKKMRIEAKSFAQEKGLKIITLPYLNGTYRQEDDGFGDVMLYNVSPKDFLSLIKYASFVLTDSFHAAVFSHIYERKFAVTGNGKSEMGCRMQSVTELFGTQERYFPDYEMLSSEKLCRLFDQQMSLNNEKYQKMRQYSFDFLNKVLKDD